ncbi:tetratricopeptide repeat protein [Croceicoccus sediminis]|uniref:tetratricopeptide repeat protein n=1 Tax=Croceicoccus sediminis TaxID=2571150 RepID=UPI0011823782|nr:tetratricopeptide repeat protein [Croceicoccus sediminis]
MRYTPIAAAISLFVAVSASSSFGQAPHTVNPQAAELIASGRTALAAGDLDAATDRFEAALAVDPASTQAYLELAEVSRAKGMQGQAIKYYREAQERDPGNLAAISGEGAAMAEKGAVKQAEGNLAKLQSMCGTNCAEAAELASVIARGPLPKVQSAEASAAVAEPAARN